MSEHDDGRKTLETLLDIVERDREERCRQVRDEAQGKAREILRQARRRARQDVAVAVRQARARGRARLDEVRAAMVTEGRQRQKAASQELLEEAWQALPGALRERWDDEELRQQWIDALLELAERSLPQGTWRLRYPAAMSEQELREVASRVAEITDSDPETEQDEGIEAGMRIGVGSARLDGTAAGLLADKRAVEGRLLAEMLREVDEAQAEEAET